MLPNKLTDFFDKPAWINRTLFYTTIFASIALAFIVIFGIFNLIFPNFTFPNNAVDYDNERYFLSALVQSLAATIALVITLSLVAVQLAAQSYSARVIDVYKRNPDMWILLCIYIITIFYGLGLTKIIGLDILGNYMEVAIFVAYFMGFFAFVCLVPYMLKTLDLLKPSTVITLLSEDITKEKVLKSVDYATDKISENDPIQSIIDMINNALLCNDYETVRNGLISIKNSITSIFDNNLFNEEEEEKLADHIIEHIIKIGIEAASRKNEDSTISAINALEEIGCKAITNNMEIASWIATEALETIGMKTSEQKLKYATERATDSLSSLGEKAAKQKHEGALRTAVAGLGTIGIKLAEDKNEIGFQEIRDSIEKLSKEAAKNNYETISQTSISLLEIFDVIIVVRDRDKRQKKKHKLKSLLEEGRKKEWDEQTMQIIENKIENIEQLLMDLEEEKSNN